MSGAESDPLRPNVLASITRDELISGYGIEHEQQSIMNEMVKAREKIADLKIKGIITAQDLHGEYREIDRLVELVPESAEVAVYAVGDNYFDVYDYNRKILVSRSHDCLDFRGTRTKSDTNCASLTLVSPAGYFIVLDKKRAERDYTIEQILLPDRT